MANQIRLALIGFGGMGQIYARMIYAGMVPEMKLTGVCCRNPVGQALLAKEFPETEVYTDVDDMAAHSEAYDACLIVTPHTSHVPIGLQLVKLGKHILMDKPAGVSAGEVQTLVEACDAAGVAFGMIFHNRRLPAFRRAKELLEQEVLGTLHRAVWVCNSWYRSPAYHRSASWRSSWNGECGGLMMNQNPHYMDMWQWFFGLPQKVYADLSFGRYNDFLVDDAVDIQLSHDHGFHGTFVSATGEAPGVNRLEIWGSKGKLTIEDGIKLYLDENRVSTEEFALTNTEKFASIPHEQRQLELPEQGNPYADVFSNFARHILYGENLYASGLDGLRTAQLINAVYVSGWEERRAAVPVDPMRYESGLALRQKTEKTEVSK